MNHIQTIADTTGADRSAAGIATTIGRLINHGTLEGGDRLPTVRALARSLDVSPSIVADAWRRLQHAGLLDTAGRR
ncbi:MAG: GntR family transcriptional regulator, partial [Actinobacteria bacterium]